MEQEVDNHIQTLFRILAIQYEDEKEERDFDAAIRIILHVKAIQTILQDKVFNLCDKFQQLMREQSTQQKKEENPLPVSKQERMELIEELLDYTYNTISDEPLILSLPVRATSTCWNNILTKEEKKKLIFIGKCGECKVVHEYPKCNRCRATRKKPGRCQSCAYIKPVEEPYSSYCGNCFQNHELPNCVECQHYRLKSGRCTNCGAIGPDDIQWDESCLDEDSNYEELMQPIVKKRQMDIRMNSKKFKTYDKCPLCSGYFHSAKACIFRKHALNFQNMKEQIQLTQDTGSKEKKPTEVTITVSTMNLQEETEEDSSDEEEYTIEEEDGEPVIQPQTSMFDKMFKLLQHMDEEEKKNCSIQTTQLQETSCELTREKFQNSICKILPDTADFPEDLFNVEGCVWCGSRSHSVFDCLGYITWLTQYFHLEQHRISYEEKLQVKKRIMERAKECHNPRRPWELYIGKEDGEYLTDKGVKILVKDRRIINLVPRHLQTATTAYADLPTPDEACVMLKLSDKAQASNLLSVMEELCNQYIKFKDEMEQLEMEFKTSMSEQLKMLQQDFDQEMQKFYTALMDDRIAQLPKQFDQMSTFLSKTVRNLHQRSLLSDIITVKTFRDLHNSRTPDSTMMWRKELCTADPTYHFRGRWRQLSDRLNAIGEYTFRANLLTPIDGNQHAEELKTIADLLAEVMQKMFHQANILEYDDLLDMEDFAIFQETVSRSIQLQLTTANQVCNSIQQMVYYSQCDIEKTLDFLDYKSQLEVFLGILLQTTMKTWGKPGKCQCDYMEKLNCTHSYTSSILHQHFPDHGE